MLAYILRRLLLMIPTIFGIMAGLVRHRAVRAGRAGGARDRAIAGRRPELDGRLRRRRRPDRRGAIAGGRRHRLALSRLAGARSEIHQGAREAIRLRQAGAGALLDSGARLFHLQFRQELLPRHSGADADQGKAAGVDIARACG